MYVRGVYKDLWVLSRRGEDKGLLYERESLVVIFCMLVVVPLEQLRAGSCVVIYFGGYVVLALSLIHI